MMNKRQMSFIRHFLTVTLVTLLVVLGLINLRDVINKNECLREMRVLGSAIKDYRQKNGSLPAESWLKPYLLTFSRLGDVNYRAQQTLYDSPKDTILAYAPMKGYSMLVKSGYVVLQLDGQVKWMQPTDFKELLKQQETARQLELYKLYGTQPNK